MIGKDAAKEKFRLVEQKITEGDEWSLDDLSVGRFFWLLSEEEVTQLKGWTEQIVGCQQIVAAEPAPSKADSAKRVRAARQREAVAAEVGALFE